MPISFQMIEMGDFLKLRVFDTPHLFAKLTWCQYCQLFRSYPQVKLVRVSPNTYVKERSHSVYDFTEEEEIYSYKKFKRILRYNDPRVTFFLSKCNTPPKTTDYTIDNRFSIQRRSLTYTRESMSSTAVRGKRPRGRPRLSVSNLSSMSATIEHVITYKATEDSPAVTKPKARSCGSQTPLHFSTEPSPAKIRRTSPSGRESPKRSAKDSPPVLYREDHVRQEGLKDAGSEKKRNREGKAEATENPYKKIFSHSSKGGRIKDGASVPRSEMNTPSPEAANGSKQSGPKEAKKRKLSWVNVAAVSQGQDKRPNECVPLKLPSINAVQSPRQQSPGTREATTTAKIAEKSKLLDAADSTASKRPKVATTSDASCERKNLSATKVPSDILKSPSHSSTTMNSTKKTEKTKSTDIKLARPKEKTSASPQSSAEAKRKQSTNDVLSKGQSSLKNTPVQDKQQTSKVVSGAAAAKPSQSRRESSDHALKPNEKSVNQKTTSQQTCKLPNVERRVSDDGKKLVSKSSTELVSSSSSKRSDKKKTAATVKPTESTRREDSPTKNLQKSGDLGNVRSKDGVQRKDDAKVQRIVEKRLNEETTEKNPHGKVNGNSEKPRTKSNEKKRTESKDHGREKSVKKVGPLPSPSTTSPRSSQKSRDSTKIPIASSPTDTLKSKSQDTQTSTKPKIIYTLKKRDDPQSIPKKTHPKTNTSEVPDVRPREQNNAQRSAAETTTSADRKSSRSTKVGTLLGVANTKTPEAIASQVGVTSVDGRSISTTTTEPSPQKDSSNAQAIASFLTAETINALESISTAKPMPAKSTASDADAGVICATGSGAEGTFDPRAQKAKEFQDIVYQYAATIASLFATETKSLVAAIADPDGAPTKKSEEAALACNTSASTASEVPVRASSKSTTDVGEKVSAASKTTRLVDKSLSTKSKTSKSKAKAVSKATKMSEADSKASKNSRTVRKPVPAASNTTEVISKTVSTVTKANEVAEKPASEETQITQSVDKPVSAASKSTTVKKPVSAGSKLIGVITKLHSAASETNKVLQKQISADSTTVPGDNNLEGADASSQARRRLNSPVTTANRNLQPNSVALSVDVCSQFESILANGTRVSAIDSVIGAQEQISPSVYFDADDTGYAARPACQKDRNSKDSLDEEDVCINLETDEEEAPANIRDVEEGCFEAACQLADGTLPHCNYVPDTVDLFLDVLTTSGLAEAKLSAPDAFLALSSDASSSPLSFEGSNSSEVTVKGFNTHSAPDSVVPEQVVLNGANAVDNEEVEVQFLVCRKFVKNADGILVVDLTEPPESIENCDSDSTELCSSVSVVVKILSEDVEGNSVIASRLPEITVDPPSEADTNDSRRGNLNEEVVPVENVGVEENYHAPDSSFLAIVNEPAGLAQQPDEVTVENAHEVFEAEEQVDIGNLESPAWPLRAFSRPQRSKSTPPETSESLESGTFFWNTVQPVVQEERVCAQLIPEEDGVREVIPNRFIPKEEELGLAREEVRREVEINGDNYNQGILLINLEEPKIKLQRDRDDDDMDSDIKILDNRTWSERFEPEIVAIEQADLQLLFSFPECVNLSLIFPRSKVLQRIMKNSPGAPSNGDPCAITEWLLSSDDWTPTPLASDGRRTLGNASPVMPHLSDPILKSYYGLADIVMDCCKGWLKIFHSNHLLEQYDSDVLKYRENIDSFKLTVATLSQKFLVHLGHIQFHNLLFASLRTYLADQRPVSMFIPYTVYYHFLDAMVLFIASPGSAETRTETFMPGLISVYNDCVTLFNKSEAELVSMKRIAKQSLTASQKKRRSESLKLKRMLLDASLLESRRQQNQQAGLLSAHRPNTQGGTTSMAACTSKNTSPISRQPVVELGSSPSAAAQPRSPANDIPEPIPSPPPMQMFEVIGNRIIYTTTFTPTNSTGTAKASQSSPPKVTEPPQSNPAISPIKVQQQPVKALDELRSVTLVNQESIKQNQQATCIQNNGGYESVEQSAKKIDNRMPSSQSEDFTREQPNGQQTMAWTGDQPKAQTNQDTASPLTPSPHTEHRETGKAPPTGQSFLMQHLLGFQPEPQQGASPSSRLQQEHMSSSDQNERQENQLNVGDFETQRQIREGARQQEVFLPPSDKRVVTDFKQREATESGTISKSQDHQQPKAVSPEGHTLDQPINLSTQQSSTTNIHEKPEQSVQQATAQRFPIQRNLLSTAPSTYQGNVARRLQMSQDSHSPREEENHQREAFKNASRPAEESKKPPPKRQLPGKATTQSNQAKKAKQPAQNEATGPEDANLQRLPNRNTYPTPAPPAYPLRHQQFPETPYTALHIQRQFQEYQRQGIPYPWHRLELQQQQHYSPNATRQFVRPHYPDSNGYPSQSRRNLLFGELLRRPWANLQLQIAESPVPAGPVAVGNPLDARDRNPGEFVNAPPFSNSPRAQPSNNGPDTFLGAVSDSTSDITRRHLMQNEPTKQCDDRINGHAQETLAPKIANSTVDPKRNASQVPTDKDLTSNQQENSSMNHITTPAEDPQVPGNHATQPTIEPSTNSSTGNGQTKTVTSEPTTLDTAAQAGLDSAALSKGTQEKMGLRTESIDSGVGQPSPAATPDIPRSGCAREPSASNTSSTVSSVTPRSSSDTWLSADEEEYPKCRVCRGDASKVCGSCRQAIYCGRTCQSEDWDCHQNECI